MGTEWSLGSPPGVWKWEPTFWREEEGFYLASVGSESGLHQSG
jgi:hypothetical protein